MHDKNMFEGKCYLLIKYCRKKIVRKIRRYKDMINIYKHLNHFAKAVFL